MTWSWPKWRSRTLVSVSCIHFGVLSLILMLTLDCYCAALMALAMSVVVQIGVLSVDLTMVLWRWNSHCRILYAVVPGCIVASKTVPFNSGYSFPTSLGVGWLPLTEMLLTIKGLSRLIMTSRHCKSSFNCSTGEQTNLLTRGTLSLGGWDTGQDLKMVPGWDLTKLL